MRTGIIFLLSAIITAGLVVVSLSFRDPLPPLIVSILLFPLWIVTFALSTRKFSGTVDTLQLQNYANVSRIRQNSERL